MNKRKNKKLCICVWYCFVVVVFSVIFALNLDYYRRFRRMEKTVVSIIENQRTLMSMQASNTRAVLRIEKKVCETDGIVRDFFEIK